MLLEKTGTNIGSICKLRIYDHKYAKLPFPVEFNGKLLGPANPQVDHGWQDLYFTRDSAHFAEQKDGHFRELLVKFRVPRDNEASLSTIMELERKRWIVEITDLNGLKKIAGRPEEPCAITMELRDHGSNRRDSNHYNMVISLGRSAPVPFASD